MNNNQAKKYLINKSLFKNPSVSFVGSGYSYNVFLIGENKKKFVLRTGKEEAFIENKLKHEYFILKFLGEEGIEFIQKPVFFDKEKKISILTYIPGKQVAVSDLNEKQLELFISQIVKINNLSYERYKSFCERNGIKSPRPKTLLEYIRQYGNRRFEYIKKNCEEKMIINWIEAKLKYEADYIKFYLMKNIKKEIVFHHYDLSGSNIILSPNGMYFIDWDKAEFLYGRNSVLSSIFIDDKKLIADKEKQLKIIELYASICKININRDKFAEAVEGIIGIFRLRRVIWAAKMFTKMKKWKLEGWEKYREWTYGRIKDYENFHNCKHRATLI